eukprot:352790-Chlamydomonas_euryale.AAC.5
MPLKKRCDLISAAPLGPLPRRLDGLTCGGCTAQGGGGRGRCEVRGCVGGVEGNACCQGAWAG